jgi:hypothetical protein
MPFAQNGPCGDESKAVVVPPSAALLSEFAAKQDPYFLLSHGLAVGFMLTRYSHVVDVRIVADLSPSEIFLRQPVAVQSLRQNQWRICASNIGL